MLDTIAGWVLVAAGAPVLLAGVTLWVLNLFDHHDDSLSAMLDDEDTRDMSRYGVRPEGFRLDRKR